MSFSSKPNEDAASPTDLHNRGMKQQQKTLRNSEATIENT